MNGIQRTSRMDEGKYSDETREEVELNRNKYDGTREKVGLKYRNSGEYISD